MMCVSWFLQPCCFNKEGGMYLCLFIGFNSQCQFHREQFKLKNVKRESSKYSFLY